MQKIKSVIIVEPDPIIALQVSRSLERFGVELQEAYESIVDAFLSLEKSPRLPELIILDIGWKEYHFHLNIAILCWEFYQVPLLFVSGLQEKDLQVHSKGKITTLLKPFSDHQLQAALILD